MIYRRLQREVKVTDAAVVAGKALAKAYAAASDVARSAADAMMASARAAAAVVRSTAGWVADKVVLVGQVHGEVVNLSVGAGEVALNEGSGKARALYRAAKRMFSDTEPPGQCGVQKCPRTDARKYQSVDVFSEPYREKLIGSTFKGAGDPALRKAMSALSAKEPPANVDEHLQTIATARGRTLDEMKLDYQLYLKANKVAAANRKLKGLQPIEQLYPEDADFMGSSWQLRYGAVVGDHMGMDPVFGAMLNPTGGLVGSGAGGARPDRRFMLDSVAYHGTYHDAMGYMYNYHGDGPGYNYLNTPLGLDTSNPWAGQTTGVPYWNAKLNAR